MTLRIRSLRTTAGILEHAPLSFAPELTTIIGARGTCKSTIIETIRFAFDRDKQRVAELVADAEKTSARGPGVGMIRATLGNGTARCEVADDDALCVVEREVTSAPRIMREGVQDHRETSLLHRIEIYSQGDLQRIADDDSLRLDLIDRPHKQRLEELRARRSEAIAIVERTGRDLRTLRAEIEPHLATLRELPALEKELAELRASRPTTSSELEEERGAYHTRETILTQATQALKTRANIVKAVVEDALRAAELAKAAETLARSDLKEAAAIGTILGGTASLLDKARSAIEEEARSPVDAALVTLGDAVKARNQRYLDLLQEQAAVSEAIRKEDALAQQIAHLTQLAADVARKGETLAGLVQRRAAAREAVNKVNDDIFDVRMGEVAGINKAHSDAVVLTLDRGTDSREYVARLSSLLAGSRIRAQDDIALEVTRKVSPGVLVEIIEAGEAARLAQLLDRDKAQMTRVVAHLAEQESLYDLERLVQEDRLEITMYDGNVPKTVDKLSKGQKATALLPLILRPADYPLIFDQPEDDLDNRFVFSTLVERIRALKARRQIIFVTHNANIPVLGEAERVVVMSMETPTSARAPIVGSVDERKAEILSLLEGGAEAFSRRQASYAELLDARDGGPAASPKRQRAPRGERAPRGGSDS